MKVVLRQGLALPSQVVLCGLFLSMVGCATNPFGSSDSPTTSTLTSKEITSFRASDPEPPPIVDKELESVPPEMQSKVEQWIAYFQGKGRGHMERYLARSTRHIQLMRRIMRQNGLPEDLVYVALIESGFSSRATSRAAAVGYWQFIKGTGRRYGLQINSFEDDRRDPVMSTQAAAEYFKGLYSVFGSWYLAMASYNVGENRVKREIMTAYTRDFWELARKRRFPKETANYIPKFIAARLIGRNPEKYGFSDIDYEKPMEFELVKVNKAVNLHKMADKMNLDYEEFKLMNPKYRGEIAPVRDQGVELRVPVGQREQALVAAQESGVEKVEFVADAGETETYKVRPGDSLFTIARKYHTTVSWLRDVNDMKAGRKLRIGMRIQVPDPSSGRRTKAPKKLPESAKTVAATNAVVPPEALKSDAPVATTEVANTANLGAGVVGKSTEDQESAVAKTEVVTTKGIYYLVQPGDTLTSIADEYDSTIFELRKMNKLGKGAVLKVGMKLRVPKDEGLPTDLEPGSGKSEVVAETVSHQVKAGENLTSIAKQYGVTLKEILTLNGLKKRAKIGEGTTLLIPVKTKPGTTVNSTTHGRRRYRQVASAPVHRAKKGKHPTPKKLATLHRKKLKARPYPVFASEKKETRGGL